MIPCNFLACFLQELLQIQLIITELYADVISTAAAASAARASSCSLDLSVLRSLVLLLRLLHCVVILTADEPLRHFFTDRRISLRTGLLMSCSFCILPHTQSKNFLTASRELFVLSHPRFVGALFLFT